jgi:hypothetical protein
VAEPVAGPLNLLVLANNLDEKGGTNRVTADLIHHLNGAFNVSAATIEADRSAYPHPAGVPIHPLQSRASGKLARTLNTLRVVPRLAGVIRKERADVVMSFLTRANLANVLARRLFRLPCAAVICERNYNSVQYAGSRSGRLLLALMRAVYPRADLVIANAEALAEDLHRSFGVARDRIRVVHNPFDLEHPEAIGGTRTGDVVRRPAGDLECG